MSTTLGIRVYATHSLQATVWVAFRRTRDRIPAFPIGVGIVVGDDRVAACADLSAATQLCQQRELAERLVVGVPVDVLDAELRGLVEVGCDLVG
jgi:hypothetical protein